MEATKILLGFLLVCVLTVNAQECNEGGFKKINCNNCYCRDRLWSCTRMDCNNPATINMKECSHGSIKQEHCNKCNCLYGHWACTSKPCPGQPYQPIYPVINATTETYPLASECYGGQTKKVDCNDCVCNAGLWDCTKRICGNTNAQFGVECTPGTFKTVDCNRCTCVNGHWDCTKNYCPPSTTPSYMHVPSTNVECVAGATKIADDGCNQCSCLGGRWACTMKACVTVSPIIQLNTNTVMHPCNNGEKGKLSCNDCQCLGNAWACTSLRC